MANITVTITDTEEKCLKYITSSEIDWLTNCAVNRARQAKENIINILIKHCNANEITIATGEEAQVNQAFSLNLVQFAKDVVTDTPE
jgi:hypothetical protein